MSYHRSFPLLNPVMEQLEQRLLLSSVPVLSPPPTETEPIVVQAEETPGAVSNFTAKDVNSYSDRYNQQVGPYDSVNDGTVTLWYCTLGG